MKLNSFFSNLVTVFDLFFISWRHRRARHFLMMGALVTFGSLAPMCFRIILDSTALTRSAGLNEMLPPEWRVVMFPPEEESVAQEVENHQKTEAGLKALRSWFGPPTPRFHAVLDPAVALSVAQQKALGALAPSVVWGRGSEEEFMTKVATRSWGDEVPVWVGRSSTSKDGWKILRSTNSEWAAGVSDACTSVLNALDVEEKARREAWLADHPAPVLPASLEPKSVERAYIDEPFPMLGYVWWSLFMLLFCVGEVAVGLAGITWVSLRDRGHLEPFAMVGRPPWVLMLAHLLPGACALGLFLLVFLLSVGVWLPMAGWWSAAPALGLLVWAGAVFEGSKSLAIANASHSAMGRRIAMVLLFPFASAGLIARLWVIIQQKMQLGLLEPLPWSGVGMLVVWALLVSIGMLAFANRRVGTRRVGYRKQ